MDMILGMKTGRLGYAIKLNRHCVSSLNANQLKQVSCFVDSLKLVPTILVQTRGDTHRGDYFEYAWTMKVTRQDGSEDYTHLLDEGLSIKYVLCHLYLIRERTSIMLSVFEYKFWSFDNLIYWSPNLSPTTKVGTGFWVLEVRLSLQNHILLLTS